MSLMAVYSGRGATGVVEVAVITPLSVVTAIHVPIVSTVHIPVVAWTFDASVIPMTTCHTC